MSKGKDRGKAPKQSLEVKAKDKGWDTIEDPGEVVEGKVPKEEEKSGVKKGEKVEGHTDEEGLKFDLKKPKAKAWADYEAAAKAYMLRKSKERKVGKTDK